MVRHAVLAVGVLVLSGCGSSTPPSSPTRVLLRAGPAPALAALPGGGLLVGEQSGRITQLRRGTTSHPYPPLTVSRGGQRGLLGLTLSNGKVFAAWTRPDRRLVVGQLRPGRAPSVRWVGPASATLANGGHLATAPDGRIILGIGDLQRGFHRGRLVALRADGSGPPATLSVGWNNPFAFTFLAGALWVADNSPGRMPERLARGDRGRPRDISVLGTKTAPSGLVALDGGALAVCGFVSGRLDRYARDGASYRFQRTLAQGCRYGAVRLTNGRVAFATGTTIEEVQG